MKQIPRSPNTGISRRLWRRPLVILLAIATVEIIAFVALSIESGFPCAHGCLEEARRSVFTEWRQQAPRAQALKLEEGDVGWAPEAPTWVERELQLHAVHPFLGYVDNPDREIPPGVEPPHAEGLAFGFLGNSGPLFYPPEEGRVIVAVIGGSVARQVSAKGRPWLEAALTAQPRFAGQEIKVISLAAGGYKAPQPAFSLAYMLAQGIHVDVAILIDGLNDIALGAKDNIPYGVHPSYPRHWRARVEPLVTDLATRRGEIRLLGHQRRALARRADAGPWRYSLVAGILWRRVDQLLAGWLETRLKSLPAPERPAGYSIHGPPFEQKSLDEHTLQAGELWERSARLLRGTADAYDLELHHFLQPNQYDGRKPLLGNERDRAYDERSPFRLPVEFGYPRLRKRGEKLTSEGLYFHDLSGIFEDVREPRYIDYCCHVNEEGIRQMAEAIAERVGAEVP